MNTSTCPIPECTIEGFHSHETSTGGETHGDPTCAACMNSLPVYVHANGCLVARAEAAEKMVRELQEAYEASHKARLWAEDCLKKFQKHQETIECCLPDGEVCGQCTVCMLRAENKRLKSDLAKKVRPL